MSTILLLNNRLQVINEAFRVRTKGRVARYHAINLELLESNEKVVTANVKYLMNTPLYRDHAIDESELDEKMKEMINTSRALSSYNRANVFVWLKRHLRLARKYEAIHRADVMDFKRWGRELEEIIVELEALKPSHAQKRLIDDALFTHSMILSEVTEGEELKHIEPCLDITWIDLIINDEFRMTKHEALQLLTLEHDNLYTLQQVAALPHELDREGFEQLVFLVNAEKSSESLFFDVYMNRMLKAIKSDKELGEKMLTTLTDIIGPIPTYTVISDEFGNVVSAERNKPNLKMIK